jgi:predicted negative regulator of RcsB-dependent stress response
MAQKVTRKELLKKPDEFMALSERGINWAREHQGISLLAASCCVLLIIIVVVGKMVYSSYQEKKRLAFQEADNLAAFPDKNSQAIEALQAFINKYGGSDLNPLARVSLARLYFEKGQYDKALGQYESALSRLEKRPEVKPLTTLGLAFCYEAKGANQKAIEALLSIKDDPANYLQEEVLFQLARLYRDIGALDKAKAAGKELLKRFPSSPYLTLSTQ